MPNTFILKDNWQRLQFFCKQQNWEKPKIVQEILPNKKHSITIIMQPLLSANHCSISPVYAKKKAINMALKQAIIYLNNELVNTPSHNLATQILLTKKEREKNELRLLKATAWNRKQEKKKQDKCILQELKRKKQIELDIKRRKTKQNIKKEGTKKGKDTLYRKYTQEEIAAMSVSKRRNLQDRGII